MRIRSIMNHKNEMKSVFVTIFMTAVDFNRNIDYFSPLPELTKTKPALTGIFLSLDTVPSLRCTNTPATAALTHWLAKSSLDELVLA